VIVRTRPHVDGRFGWAIDVESGGALDASRLYVGGASFAGVAVTDKGSRAKIEDAVISGVVIGNVGPGSPNAGLGIAVTELGTIEVARTTVVSTADSSLLVAGGGKATAQSVTLRTAGGTNALGGVAAMDPGSEAKLADAAVVAADYRGLSASASATVDVNGVLVADTKTTTSSSSGMGAIVASKGTLRGTRLTLQRNAGVQLGAIGGATIALSKLVTLEARAGRTENFGGTGIGLLLDDASRAKLDGAYLGKSRMLGVSMRRASVLEATGIVIDGVTLAETFGGYGLLAIEGSTATIADASVLRARGAAFVVGEAGSSLSLARATLRDIGLDAQAETGRALSLQAGAAAAFDRVRILGSGSAAFYVTGPGTLLGVTASTVTRIEPHPSGKFGDAFEIVDGAELHLDRSVVRESHGAALVFAGGKGWVSASLVERNAVGIHAQDGSSLSEASSPPEEIADGAVVITTTTRFVENASRIGTGVVPLPDALPVD
jgi:hypothetical protein